jgi:hypothetical protein
MILLQLFLKESEIPETWEGAELSTTLTGISLMNDRIPIPSQRIQM